MKRDLSGLVFLLGFIFLASFIDLSSAQIDILPRGQSIETEGSSIIELTTPEPVINTVNSSSSSNNSNCWQSDCSGFRNPFNQILNTTSNVQFSNINTKNVSSTDTILGRDIILNQAGTAIFPDTSFTINPVSLGSGLVSIAMLVFSGGAGLTIGAIQDGLYILPALATTSPRILLSRNQDATDVVVFEVQNTTGDLSLIRQNPFVGGYSANRLNATAWNITSEHQRYDITSTTSLDTQYKNSQGRVIYLDVSFQSSYLSTGDIAYATLNNQTAIISSEGIEYNTRPDSGDAGLEKHHMGAYIQAGENWTIVTNVGGNGAIVLEKVVITVI